MEDQKVPSLPPVQSNLVNKDISTISKSIDYAQLLYLFVIFYQCQKKAAEIGFNLMF